MKILLINWRCIKNPEAGGAEIHLHEIFKRVAALGHSVTLVSHHYKNAPREEIIDGIKVIRIGNKYLFHYQFKRFYKSVLKNQGFDLVVDDISKIPMNTPTYINEPLAGIIHHLHGKTLFRELPFPMAYYIYKREINIPKYYSKTPIFAVSPSTKNELNQLGQPADKIELLYNAIDQKLFENRKFEKTEYPLITYIGRIKKYKNLEKIVDALKILIVKFPNAKLEIGGTGDHLDKLKKYVAGKSLSDFVTFLGFVPEEDKPEAMGRAWVFVTMAQKEGWGITVVEANAANTPVIGSNVEGLCDSIQNNSTGLLVPPDDSDALADAIISFFNDRTRLDEMSVAAKSWSEKFTWDSSASHFLETIYKYFPELKN